MNRIDLQNKLEEILGSRNVYFQPPESMKMNYPAIVYSRSGIKNDFANDKVYMQSYVYTVTVIDKDPDSEITCKIAELPNCKFDRNFKSGNLNHDVFTLYF